MESSPQAARVVIVAATDGSPASKEAMAAAARFGSLPGSELHLVYVLDPGDAARRPEAIAEGQALLESVAKDAGFDASLHLAVGVAWREIVQLSADLQADVVIVGTHDRSGLQRVILGSVAEQVVKKARCPVFVARPKDHSDAVPEIEPPCAKCVAVQASSNGERLWCDQHSERHVRGRLHYEMPQGFGAGSQLIRPS